MKNKVRVLALILASLMLFGTFCSCAGCVDSEHYYTVSFDTDGGSSVKSITVKENSKIGELPSASKSGYKFLGWSDKKGGSVNIDGQYVVTKDVTLYAVFEKDGTGNPDDPGTKEETCTVTYSTSGTLVNVTSVKKGQAIGSLPFTDKPGYSFLGWFFDKELKNRVYAEDVITQDVTLYAGFEKQDVDSVLPEYTELSIGSDDVNYEIGFKSSEVIDERNLGSFISITALYGEVPKISVIAGSDGKYTLSPIGGFQNGGVYKITITDDRVSFVDLDAAHGDDYTDDKAIKTVYLSVEAADEEIVAVKSGVFEMNRSSVTFSESEGKFTATKAVFEKLPFKTGATVHILDGADDFYIKITDIKEVSGGYEFSYSDCDSVDDVYEDFNINVGDISVTNDMTLPENQLLTEAELAAVVEELYNSKGTEALTQMLANALNNSPTLYAITSNNPYRDNISDVTGKAFTLKGLMDDLEIKVSLGSAKNPNFNGIGISPFDDTRWTMLEMTFNYETEIKNNVKLEATITVTQYLYVGLAASANKSTGNFKAEITPFSQTDISFKVLVCSMSKDGEDDKDKDNKKEEKKDISVEIENLVNGEGDSSNIIKDVQEMLENKGDAIELCKVPLFTASYTVGGVLSINFDLNFVIKISFAAGVKIDATLLEATTIGVTGNYKTKTIDCYRRAAQGSDRYIFDFYAYGYLGVKAGIEGEVTVSFTGLKQVLRAGVGIEVGAYADLYGYLHYHAEERRVFKDVDTNGRHYQTLEGGMYFESGIYLELRAFIGIGKKEFGVSKEFKFKLLDAGDKYLYIEACKNDDITIIFNENELNSVSLDDLIPAEGKFMDITTGEIETRVIPSKNIKLISDTNLFRIDSAGNTLVANMEKITMRLSYGIPSGTLTVYYKGPNILFSSAYLAENIAELKGFKELCKVTVVYLPTGVSLEDASVIGKEVTVTYKVISELGEETVKTEKILAGQYYKGGIPSEIVSYCRRNGLLAELDGKTVTYDGFTEGKHIITEDTTFVFKTATAQRFIAIQYRSQSDFTASPDVWTVDIMAIGYNELPTLLQQQKYTPENIYYEYFVITPDGERNVMGNEYLSKYDLYMRGTHGFETGKVLRSVTGTLEELELIFDQMKKGEGDLKDYSEFFTYTLKAEYITGMHKVYFYAPNGDCGEENVKYGETFRVPDYWLTNINQSASERIIGWDTDGDGKADILPNQQFTVTSDMVLRPVMTANGYTITVIDFEGNETQCTVDAGSAIPKEILDKINSDPGKIAAPGEDSFYSESYWQITTTDFVAGNNRTPYFRGISWKYERDITVMPACDIVFRGVKGDLYHYVTLTDTTGGYFEVKNADGTVSKLTTVRIAVKDGSYVGYADDYDNIRYVVPKEDMESGFSNNCLVSSDSELLDIYGTVVTAPKTYNMQRYVIRKNTYSIIFEYYLYDEYGNRIGYEKKHEMIGVSEEVYKKLCEEYDREYEYLRSAEFYAENNTPEYTYRSYANGSLDYNSANPPDYYGVIYRYYGVAVQKSPVYYDVTEIMNIEYYENQEVTTSYRYNTVFTCPDATYYKFVKDEYGYTHDHYFAGYDADGDGVVDYLPGEKILITKNMRLSSVWKCSRETPCGKD